MRMTVGFGVGGLLGERLWSAGGEQQPSATASCTSKQDCSVGARALSANAFLKCVRNSACVPVATPGYGAAALSARRLCSARGLSR